MSVFAYQFMQYALLGTAITGLTAPALGIYLVQRRLSLIGDGIGHVALTGVGIGVLLHKSPVLVATLAAIVGSVAVEIIRERSKTSGDIALAILFYGGISGGVFLIGLSGASQGLNAFLFGSPLTITHADMITIVVLGVAVLLVSLGLRPWLFAVCQDEEYARVAGLPVRTLNVIVAVTAAVTVTTAMRSIGLLLVSALMVVPVATAQLITRGFRSTMALSMALGLASAVLGVMIAGPSDTAVGATVVLFAIALFLVVAVGSAGLRAWRLRSMPVGQPACDPPDVLLKVDNR
jgi:zinc transport system permease protein